MQLLCEEVQGARSLYASVSGIDEGKNRWWASNLADLISGNCAEKLMRSAEVVRLLRCRCCRFFAWFRCDDAGEWRHSVFLEGAVRFPAFNAAHIFITLNGMTVNYASADLSLKLFDRQRAITVMRPDTPLLKTWTHCGTVMY